MTSETAPADARDDRAQQETHALEQIGPVECRNLMIIPVTHPSAGVFDTGYEAIALGDEHEHGRDGSDPAGSAAIE